MIEQDIADAKTVGVAATPEFHVNGRPLPSFGYDQLRALVDEELIAAGGQLKTPTGICLSARPHPALDA